MSLKADENPRSQSDDAVGVSSLWSLNDYVQLLHASWAFTL